MRDRNILMGERQQRRQQQQMMIAKTTCDTSAPKLHDAGLHEINTKPSQKNTRNNNATCLQ